MLNEQVMRLIELYEADETLLDEGEPSLVAAVRHKPTGQIFRGRPGQAHWDVAKDNAMAGPGWKDRVDLETGFINNKGHFLNRERALAYAIRHDLIHDYAKRYLATPDAPAELGASFLSAGTATVGN